MRGITALMHACAAPFYQNHPEVVQMLLDKGAEVNAIPRPVGPPLVKL